MGGSMSKTVVFRSKGSVFRHRRDDFTLERVRVWTKAVAFVSRWSGEASIPVVERKKPDGLRGKSGHLAPIENGNASIADAKTKSKVGNGRQSRPSTPKTVVNRPIHDRSLGRVGRNRDSRAVAAR